MKNLYKTIILLLVFQNTYSQKIVSIDSINKFIFKNDLNSVYRNSTYSNEKILKEKLDSIHKIKLMYNINTDNLHTYENKNFVYAKDSISDLKKKSITNTYRLSPKYYDFFKEGHTIQISYETYEDENCNIFSSNCKKFDHKLTSIKIINNYLKEGFNLNNYLEVFFNTDKEHKGNIYISNKDKTLGCNYNTIKKSSLSFIEDLDGLEFLKETKFNLNQESDLYIINFTKIYQTSNLIHPKGKKHFNIIFNPSNEKMIINVDGKFCIVKNSKIEELEKWVSEQFKIK